MQLPVILGSTVHYFCGSDMFNAESDSPSQLIMVVSLAHIVSFDGLLGALLNLVLGC